VKKVFILPFVLLVGCASAPTGPAVLVLPGTGKSFDSFRSDDAECRNYAYSQAGGKAAEQAGSDSVAKGAVIGTAVGAVVGGAFGGSGGAATGAGFGLATGALAGASASHASSYTLQQRYDIGYTQCMYTKGHKVPMAVREVQARRSAASRAPSSAPTTPRIGTTAPPPPPPGRPPAEPPPDYKG
jgi:hypothetical protein